MVCSSSRSTEYDPSIGSTFDKCSKEPRESSTTLVWGEISNSFTGLVVRVRNREWQVVQEACAASTAADALA